jgi:hypothetical protein
MMTAPCLYMPNIVDRIVSTSVSIVQNYAGVQRIAISINNYHVIHLLIELRHELYKPSTRADNCRGQSICVCGHCCKLIGVHC